MTRRMGTLGRARAVAALALLGVAAVCAGLLVLRSGGEVSGEAPDAANSAAQPGCGQGRADEARAERVWRRLGQAPEGAQLLTSLPRRPRICFADVDPSVVVGAEELLLDARLDGDAAAARAGHLVSHLVARDDLDPARADDCAAFAAKALAAETRAHQLEARLLGDFGDAEAAAALAATAVQRAAAVVDGYRSQCERRGADAGG
jgi:hypothetical protein